MITTLSFDLDDTLWPIAPAIEAAEQALRDWLQQHWPTVANAWSADRMAELRDGLWQQHPELAHD
ncbi:MAG: HAD family hydrolase, partial [Xanthomonadales bacterium]|nr:HAD family hydrolase [Xanthomonadales bacterium]